LLTLTFCPPLPRKGGHPAVGAGETKHYKIGMHLLQRLPFFACLPGIALQPARQLLRKRVKLTRPFRCRELGLDRIGLQILLDRVARQSGAALDLTDRQTLTQPKLTDNVQ
jgi:hypothetical protein